MEIHHQQCPPLSVLILNDTTLMDICAIRCILIDLGDIKLRAILTNTIFLTAWNPSDRSCMIAESLVGSDGDGLVRTPDALGTRTESTAIRFVIGRDEVIYAVDLIHVMPLAHCITFRNDGVLRLLDGTTHISLQLRTLDLAIAMNGINLPIVVEKHGEIIDTSLHVMMLPGASDVLAGIALQTLAVDIGKDIELAVGITDGRRPDTLPINLLMILQREGIVVEVETVEAIADILPVHKIFRMQDDQAGHCMHSSTRQIIVITHTKDVGIRELVIEKRIGKSAVTIVGRP